MDVCLLVFVGAGLLETISCCVCRFNVRFAATGAWVSSTISAISPLMFLGCPIHASRPSLLMV